LPPYGPKLVRVHPLVILVDVDHTLLDGDAVRASISAALRAAGGEAAVAAFWSHYEAVRAEFDGVNVPETARRAEVQLGLPAGSLAGAVDRADFSTCLFPAAFDVLAHLASLGRTVVLSDGDPSFQRAKIVSAGIAAAVEGRVLVVPHKERAIEEVTNRFPAAHYALLDDRASILGAVKAQLGERVTTVRVRQGRYSEERPDASLPPADVVLPAIAAALTLDDRALLGGEV
jgi:FMN phosphatase YigB (HAD superfamily)